MSDIRNAQPFFIALLILLAPVLIQAQATNKIDTFGNIGIGTTSPNSLLHVRSDGGMNSIMRLRNSNTSYRRTLLQFEDYSGAIADGFIDFNVASGTSTGAFMGMGINTNTQLVLKGSGNIGIGTTTPAYKLDINGTLHTAGQSNLGGGSFYASTDQVFVTAAQYTFRDAVGINNPNGTSFASGTSVMSIGNMSNGNSLITTGNIGIGTAIPAGPLEVYGADGGYLHYVTGGSTNDTRVALRNGSLQGQLEMDIFGGTTPYAFIQTGKSANIPLQFSAASYTFNNGNVGIGTISPPSEKLSVNGNISAKKMIVTQTGWSDYVFNNDYKLKSLTEVESFIKQNKHLPEVPSAKEVEEKGISVGDNQALLLKKLEELTLYVIDMQKQLNNASQKIANLEKKNAKKNLNNTNNK